MSTVSDTLVSFAVLFAVFLPLERLFPAHRQAVLREQWLTDLAFFLGQYLLWTAPVVAVLVFASQHAAALPLGGIRAFVHGLPFWLQFVVVILVSDASIYWAHRWSHTNRFLWRFHRVHHTAPKLDWLAAHREHPFDNLYTRLVENLPLIALGFPLHALAGFAMFRGLWALYIHSNVSLTPGPLRYLIGAPRLHHWHHEVERGGRVNFANLSPLMDLAFGTFHDPGHFPERYGMGEPVSTAYVAQLLEPLLPRAWWSPLRARAGALAAGVHQRTRRGAVSARRPSGAEHVLATADGDRADGQRDHQHAHQLGHGVAGLGVREHQDVVQLGPQLGVVGVGVAAQVVLDRQRLALAREVGQEALDREAVAQPDDHRVLVEGAQRREQGRVGGRAE